ncbi:hypothetical protein [Rhabdochlamydiaceae symbiont of Dictyostelium giganteum]|uniref:hypothetical protein n=1 Tax=Rhabdochlamydiaceae symbiont of Dictyostelium giganteum TaxID=3342349 RepID=UPI00384A9EA7
MTPLKLFSFTNLFPPILKSHSNMGIISLNAINQMAKRCFSSKRFSVGDVVIFKGENPLKGENISQKTGRPGVIFKITKDLKEGSYITRITIVFFTSLKGTKNDERGLVIQKDEWNNLTKDSRLMSNQVLTIDDADNLIKKIGVLTADKCRAFVKTVLDSFKPNLKRKSEQGNIVEVKAEENLLYTGVVISNGKQEEPTAIVAKIIEEKNRESSLSIATSFQKIGESQRKNIVIDVQDINTASRETMTVVGKVNPELATDIYNKINQ